MIDAERMKKEIEGWLEEMKPLFLKKKTADPERSLQRVFALARAIAVTQEVRDTYKEGHQFRVSDLARAIAEEMGLQEERITGLRLAGLIHDVGKINIPAELLNKETRLTESESREMQTHVESGYEMLKGIRFPWPVARMVLEHHERLDGSGYPKGLKGKRILLESRILAAADVVDAITSKRSYRPAREVHVALYSMKGDRGDLYDQDVVDACLKLFDEKGYKMLDLD
jgi:putative nucleotidyltransferase with HDIG domain